MEVVGRNLRLSRAEQSVLKWLEAGLSELPGTIFVELPIKGKYTNCMWPDFVIVSPTHGVCVLECKGYGSEEIRLISKAEDLETVHGIDRVMKQMSLYGCLMKNLLSDLPVSFCKSLIFPGILASDSVAPLLSTWNEQNQQTSLLFHDNMDWECTLEVLFGEPMKKKLLKEELQQVVDVLNPIHILEHDYSLDLEKINHKITSLDKQQIKYLARIKDGHHYVLNGLPGTGKTVMLVKLAERERANNKKVFYSCFNRPLADSVIAVLGADCANSTHGLYARTLRKKGISYASHPDWEKKTLSTLLEIEFEPEFDYLLIDEYQDLENIDYRILLKHLKPGGTLVLAGDKLQNIKGKDDTWREKGIDVANGGRSMFLKRPYRTEPDVVDFALKFISKNNYLKNEAEKYFDHHKFAHEFGDFSQLQQRMKFIVAGYDDQHEQIRKIYSSNPDADILVVTVYRYQENKDSIPLPARGKTEPYTRMKGLEGDIVILYNVDFYDKYQSGAVYLSPEQKMRSIFSALCRSKGDVYIHCKNPEGFYEHLKAIYLECIKAKAA